MEKLLDKIAKRRMLAWSLEGFKRNYPRLFGAIIEVMCHTRDAERENMMKFHVWYSGMDRSKVDKAYERYCREVEDSCEDDETIKDLMD